jgi:pyruvate formate lyase activating enzyme
MEIPALYEKRLDSKQVQCMLCPAECHLTEGKIGICGSRFNREGRLICDNFGELVSACYDPIEKKPLYHFYPGSVIFSAGPNGCSFHCANCQNWEISQTRVRTQYIAPDDLVKLAGQQNSIGVAYTYSEPLIWFEYLLTSGQKIKKAGLKNVLVTNGYINPEPLEELLPIIDAANIDLKSMDPDFYKKVCKAKLAPVLDNIVRFYEAGVHVEITNLVITDLNDSESDFIKITDFVSTISHSIPLHFSAYYPTYKMNNPATSLETLLNAFEIAKEKLDYVYLGNVRLTEKSNTYCPQCGTSLIIRHGYYTSIEGLKMSSCLKCGYKTGIIHQDERE